MTTPVTRRTPTRPGTGATRTAGGKPLHFEWLGIGLIALGIIIIAATWLHGPVPDALHSCMRWLFGEYGAWVVALAMILAGLTIIINLAHLEITATLVGTTILFLVAISMLQMTEQIDWRHTRFTDTAGGLFGCLIAGGLRAVMGSTAWVVLAAFGLVGLSLLSEVPLWVMLSWPFRLLGRGLRALAVPIILAARERREEARAAKVAALKEAEIRRRNRPDPEEKPVKGNTKPESFFPPRTSVVDTPEPAPPKPVKIIDPPDPAPRITGVPSKENPEQLAFVEGVAPSSTRPYKLPPMDLLNTTPKPAKQSVDDTGEMIAVLEKTLASFGIDAKVDAVERGPRVTRFEVIPPPGIRINRITNLADNIALSLKALDVRVEAPVPGKGVVGIEVPNKESVIVDLREIMESEVMRKSKSPLTFALGRDIAGHPRIADLTRMPHLLIAGQTNSGKSVCINCLLSSILMRATPQQAKFLLVDPKRVELSLYQNIPHLIAPVAYDAKHAAGLLRWAIREMEQRYEMFAEKGVRNIVGFNDLARLEGLEEYYYIVIIIDELADLMMQAAAEFEASICRLAQLARATGIHLVVATQRPSVNVITGTIKANIPSRISFAVASQVDSRTILDMNGAERLVGQGDMLYLPVEASKPLRIQGAYMTEAEINRIVEHVKQQGKPIFTDEIVTIEEEALREETGGEYGNNEPEDDLYEKALDYVRTTKYASTSMLQRKFRIGYTRAARLMDQFEERGYVGPGQGSKPREVIFAPSSSVTGRPADQTMADDISEDDIFPEDA